VSKRRNLELNLGRVCNNRCVICLDLTAPQESRRWLPLERAAAELERARAEGTTSVGLLGGEPTAHPHVLDIVARARELGFSRVALSTNALKLEDAALARALVDAGATRFTVSVHAHTAADEDHISGREGNFVRKQRAIAHLVELRRGGLLPDNVSLNAVLTTRLVGAMAEFAVHYRRMGVRDIRFNMIRTDPCPGVASDLTPRLAELAPAILRTVAVNARALRMDLSWGDLPLCVWPWEILAETRLARAVIGELRDLETWVAVFRAPADATRDASRFRWTERKRDALKVQPDLPCGRCAAAPACEGLWRSYNELFGAGELAPIRPLPRWIEEVLA
jgi:MoaA/NifB/PqqE/SkfB family radical SAM enzyme